MPIYEFYCPRCHRIFSFLSRRIRPEGRPPCPDCQTPLQKEISIFAHPRRTATDEASGPGDDADSPPVDEARLEQAMASMAGEIENIDEDDPRQAAHLMRRFSDIAGMRFNESMQEALARMEAGEDPETIESELGEALENEDPFEPGEKTGNPRGKRSRAHRGAPSRDPVLHEM